jgi:hypothetical protein
MSFNNNNNNNNNLQMESRLKRYQNLDSDGICEVGTILPNGGIIINKVIHQNSHTQFSPLLQLYVNVFFDLFKPHFYYLIQESPLNPTDSGDGSILQAVQYKPVPIVYKSAAPAVVDKVIITSNENENFVIKAINYFKTI